MTKPSRSLSYGREAFSGVSLRSVERARQAAKPAIDVLQELLDTWSHAHGVDLPDLAESCEIVWGTLYGIATLGNLGTIGTERAQSLAEQALTAILRGWRTGEPASGRGTEP